MKAKHPVYYIAAGIAIVLIAIAAVQAFLHLCHTLLFWELLITLLVGAIVLLIVSLLLYTRKISPQTRLLPPPFGR